MKSIPHSRHRQQGAVAIIVGLSLVMLILFIGLVVDLGRTYILKTELQNAADAGALAASWELNGTAAGVQHAITSAIDTATQNDYRFDVPVNIDPATSPAQLMVGNCPDASCNWISAASAAADATNALAADKLFFRVDTGQQSIPTFLMGLAGITQTQTYGLAVAGRSYVNITPLAICALDFNKCPTGATPDPDHPCGFDTGKSYNVGTINPIGPGTLYWLDPVATSSTQCNGNVPDTLPFLCQGKSSIATTMGATVFTNTGVSTPQLEALDSRFGSYGASAKCDPATAPPDTNIREYDRSTNRLFQMDPTTTPACTQPGQVLSGNRGCSWQSPLPGANQSSICTQSGGIITCDWSGVAWSANRPPSTLPTGAPAITSAYPSSGAPYAASSLTNFYTSGGSGAVDGRRLLSMIVVKCSTSGGNCRPAEVQMVGQFFLQKKTNNPSDKNIYLEFVKLVPAGQIQPDDYRLFR